MEAPWLKTTRLASSGAVHPVRRLAHALLLPSCRGVKPSVTSFNSLITAASDGGSYDALLEVGLPPGPPSAVILAFAPRALARRFIVVLHLPYPPCTSASPPALPCGRLPSCRCISPCPPPPLRQVGRCLAQADPEVQACVMNTYVAGLVKVQRREG